MMVRMDGGYTFVVEALLVENVNILTIPVIDSSHNMNHLHLEVITRRSRKDKIIMQTSL